MPRRWKEALICPLHKKGDTTNSENYRGIAIMDTIYNIMAISIKNRLKEIIEPKLGQYQCGFRKNRSVMDQIFVLKQIIDNTIDQNMILHMLFIDYKQAYDRIIREYIYEAMDELKIKGKLIRLVRMTLTDTTYKVKMSGHLSESFCVDKGLSQGDPLSTTLFNIVMDKIIEESSIASKGTIYSQKTQVLAYADDIVIVTRTREHLVN
ncbi:hypothetical protein HHI36_008154 [Cryptolaemus montrouzieri]|uniref:Reverse transcriptase domain-containing protein n=1 Tax=Cryptolaemus montrouzieri TaxID=559131 RepID=A0ABD2MRI4_9CUCU